MTLFLEWDSSTQDLTNTSCRRVKRGHMKRFRVWTVFMVPVWEQVRERAITFELKYWWVNSQRVRVSALQGHGGGISHRFGVYFLCNHRGNCFAHYRPFLVLADCWLNHCLLCSTAGLMINRLKPLLTTLCCSYRLYLFRTVTITAQKRWLMCVAVVCSYL